MANRIGKYKLSKKEAELSLADGGEVKGDLKIMGKLNKPIIPITEVILLAFSKLFTNFQEKM